jgi:hypothetical protein
MTKYLIIIMIGFSFTACKTKVSNNDNSAKTTLYQDSSIRSVKKAYKEMDIEKEVIFNAPNDTGSVIIQSSNIRFIIHYINNKPQGILIQPNQEKDNLVSHFVRENKGVFVSIDPKTNAIGFVGYKYLRNSEGADISIGDDGNTEQFTTWRQYSSDGKTYDVTQADAGKIKVYVIKDGERADSLLYLRK